MAAKPASKPENDDMRFSDGELVRLREEFELHQERFEQHQEVQEARWEQLAIMVEQNTQTTRDIAESVKSVADSTAGVVKIYEDMQGAARVGGAVQKFILWLAKWGTIGGGMAVGISWLIRHFTPPG